MICAKITDRKVTFDIVMKWVDDGVHFPAFYFSDYFFLPDDEEATPENIKRVIEENIGRVVQERGGYNLEEELNSEWFLGLSVYNVKLETSCKGAGFKMEPKRIMHNESS